MENDEKQTNKMSDSPVKSETHCGEPTLSDAQPTNAALDTFIPEKVPLSENGFVYNLKQILLIFAAALATAVAVEIFLLPSDVVIGGALGISSILDILLTGLEPTKWYASAGVWIIAVNVPILIYCFASYRRRFAVKTCLYILFLGGLMALFRALGLSAVFADLIAAEGEQKVLYVLLGGALHGISLPLMLSVNASTGGSDIVGLMAQKRAKQTSSIAMRVILATNILVVLVSAVVVYFVRGNAADAVSMFIYSVAAMFVCEIVQEWIFKGFSAAVEVEITTEKPIEMVAALQSGVKHGTTTLKVLGGYTHTQKYLVICVVNKQQLTHARRIINQVDPKAFAYVENVKEVLGKGFSNKEIELDDNGQTSK